MQTFNELVVDTKSTGLYPCKNCFFESIISLDTDTRVEEIKGLSLLEIVGILGGIWIVFDTLIMFFVVKLSQRIYKASLVRSMYKFNPAKTVADTQILGTSQTLRTDWFPTFKQTIGRHFNSKDLKIHRLL